MKKKSLVNAVLEQSSRATIGRALGLREFRTMQAVLRVELVEEEGVVDRRPCVDFDLKFGSTEQKGKKKERKDE